jgi:hypothetical protein
MLRRTFVTTMLDAGVDLRDVQIAARHADPRTTMRYDNPQEPSTATRTASWPPTWPPAPDRTRVSRVSKPEDARHCRIEGVAGPHTYALARISLTMESPGSERSAASAPLGSGAIDETVANTLVS